ncbi:MAG TPA: citrate synthase [Candidatus Hydrogenedentes bacterium]|nr:citrate synthase [Candidatus Hydrogenedentota bacterium]HOV74935.1 citrate synthase [Candidatus Hydrogenedentota bacterium]HPC16705.1 citrate synthase [Candidatus Hydrogenedentota bacterium]HRT21922.1 citrate synthase [Candidatus Hydrogenedentota bacterium]HRT66914.1 citrate synthase [Candidatus Hydrogenedentota bacterium]
MKNNVKLTVDGQEHEFPVIEGSEGERAMDISSLRDKTGLVTYDPGYANTASCKSDITFVDGDKGILRYRGYPIEELAVRAKFPAVAHLLIYGHLPNREQSAEWRRKLTLNSYIHEDLLKFFEGFPPQAHPMAILSAMVASLSAYYPHFDSEEETDLNIVRLLAQAKTIAAFSYKKSIGQPRIYPRTEFSYAANFLRMMFATPAEEYVVPPVLEEALNMLLIVHADHEQNCSTSTVRMACSSRTNLFSAVSAGICALWGPLHGGANQAVIEMLEGIQADGGNYRVFIDRVKRKEALLMGFGHRVYKNHDPRSRILKASMDRILNELGIHDPLVELAKNIEEIVLEDDFFVSRKLYPNVDFYSGIIYRAMGIPTNMFTVMFALGRIPGWIAHWREMHLNTGEKIHRPRQIYTGLNMRPLLGLYSEDQTGAKTGATARRRANA